MKTQTDYYGEIEYNLSDLIVVADGFFGFPELKQFLPLRLDEDNDSLLLMQSVENSQVAFVVIAPTILCPGLFSCPYSGRFVRTGYTRLQ